LTDIKTTVELDRIFNSVFGNVTQASGMIRSTYSGEIKMAYAGLVKALRNGRFVGSE
jgi:hypothetical protein